MNIDQRSKGVQFGYGLFETIRIEKGQPEYLLAHYNRLAKGLKALKMPSVAYKDFKALVLANTTLATQVIKITCLEQEGETLMIPTTREVPYTQDQYTRGFSIGLSPYSRHSSNPLLQMKTTNGIALLLEHQSKPLDDMIHLNENYHLTEGIYSNLFLVKSGELLTPAVACGLLPGIMRAEVIKLAKKHNINIQTGHYSLEDLRTADEVFLTNSVMRVMPVSQFEEVLYNRGEAALTKLLIKELSK